MTSERRIAANRANARRSTGPKTLQGKTAVRSNALRHGLLSRDVVIAGEDAEVFNELRSTLRTELAPSGAIERFLVDRIINLTWRLRRLERVESTLFQWRFYEREVERRSAAVGSFLKTTQSPDYPMLPSYFTTVITNEAGHANARREFDSAKAKLDQDSIFIGRSFDQDASESDAFGKIARYESFLERSLFKALHELERRQARRQGQPVSIPQAVDLNVSVNEHE